MSPNAYTVAASLLTTFLTQPALSSCIAERWATETLSNVYGFTPAETVTSDEFGASGTLVQYEDFGFVLSTSVWLVCKINVCWEADYENFQNEMALTRGAIEDSWGAASALEFIGWEICPERPFVGLSVEVWRGRPQTEYLGRQLSGLRGGIKLNWDATSIPMRPCSCPDGLRDCEKRTQCIVAQAVHEFGHAIGISHEQNRTDKDKGCVEPVSGKIGDTQLTPYDPKSVMNYCNPGFNAGMLSEGDKATVQAVYGVSSTNIPE